MSKNFFGLMALMVLVSAPTASIAWAGDLDDASADKGQEIAPKKCVIEASDKSKELPGEGDKSKDDGKKAVDLTKKNP